MAASIPWDRGQWFHAMVAKDSMLMAASRRCFE